MRTAFHVPPNRARSARYAAGCAGAAFPGERPTILWIMLTAAIIGLTGIALLPAGAAESQPDSKAAQYAAEIPKTIVELQPFRRHYGTAVQSPDGRSGNATLVNLNPSVNIAYLLQIDWRTSRRPLSYHLENPAPEHQEFVLDEKKPGQLVIVTADRQSACSLMDIAGIATDSSTLTRVAYVPLCGGRLFLRKRVKGHRTAIESITDFLRDRVPGGESVVSLVRDTLYKDAYRREGRLIAGQGNASAASVEGTPNPAAMEPGQQEGRIVPPNLGLALTVPLSQGLRPGRWYAVADSAGMYASIIRPNLIAAKILAGYSSRVRSLDRRETAALVYLIAFDLDHFKVGFAVGTVHPRVGWSRRVIDAARDSRLPGPDGIGTIAPLVATGLISPAHAGRTAATFTGGFKRSHGAFKYGPLSRQNHGSHYGFIENGVVYSKLRPGLASLLVYTDGTIEMKTWNLADDAGLECIRHARQNGVPIIEFDAPTQESRPGALVGRWGRGNWSGSKDKKLRTLRAGLALQHHRGKRFLIYGYFSNATPSAMARVFQAYGCRYAMHLDMNALEHTYLALYDHSGGKLQVRHLIKGMEVLDQASDGKIVPRFLGYADNRDFFYLLRR